MPRFHSCNVECSVELGHATFQSGDRRALSLVEKNLISRPKAWGAVRKFWCWRLRKDHAPRSLLQFNPQDAPQVLSCVCGSRPGVQVLPGEDGSPGAHGPAPPACQTDTLLNREMKSKTFTNCTTNITIIICNKP